MQMNVHPKDASAVRASEIAEMIVDKVKDQVVCSHTFSLISSWIDSLKY